MYQLEIFIKNEMFFNFPIFVVVTVPPLYVLIQGLNHPLISGVRTQISCVQTGAR